MRPSVCVEPRRRHLLLTWLFGAVLAGAAGASENPVRTANPNASPAAVSFLAYLHALPERATPGVLVGQNVGHANYGLDQGYAKYYTGLQAATGFRPAILGVDYGYEKMSATGMSAANQLMIRHARDGGVVTISVSPPNPLTGGGLRDRSTGGGSLAAATSPGTEAFRRWRATLDMVADALTELRDAGVVVLWRPLHEMNGDFFWWSAGLDSGWATPDDFRALWRDMFRYYTQQRGLNNLLWVYAPNYQSNEGVKPVDFYYPGDEYVDVVGLDYYENTLDFLDARGSYSRLVATRKPFAITEVGPAFWLTAHPRGDWDTTIVIDAIRKRYPATTYFVFWQGWSALLMDAKMGLVENRNARELLSAPGVVPLERLDWRPPR